MNLQQSAFFLKFKRFLLHTEIQFCVIEFTTWSQLALGIKSNMILVMGASTHSSGIRYSSQYDASVQGAKISGNLSSH